MEYVLLLLKHGEKHVKINGNSINIIIKFKHDIFYRQFKNLFNSAMRKNILANINEDIIKSKYRINDNSKTIYTYGVLKIDR